MSTVLIFTCAEIDANQSKFGFGPHPKNHRYARANNNQIEWKPQSPLPLTRHLREAIAAEQGYISIRFTRLATQPELDIDQ